MAFLRRPAVLRVRRIAYWVAIVALLFILIRRVAPPLDLTDLGEAPPLEMTSLDGEDIRLSDYRGKVVVVNVWATWCPPCRFETPGFVRLQEEFGSDVRFLGVSTDTERTPVVDFAERMEMNYPVMTGRNRAGNGYNVSVLPTTIVIDKEGHMRMYHQGALLSHALRRALTELVAE